MRLPAFPSFTTSLRHVLLATLLLVPPLATAASVCVMRSGERLLLVQDVTSRWQLPGGTAEHGELPQQTAAREALEEAGFAVATTDLLDDRAGVHVFACRALEPVQVHGNAVNVLDAPHLGREIIQARWVSRDEARQLRTRFPQQLEHAYQRLHAVAESEVRPVARFGAASAFRQAELDRVHRTQQWPVRGLAMIGNVLGEFWFYLLAMPVLWVAFGAQASRLMLMALMVVTLAVQSIKVFARCHAPSASTPRSARPVPPALPCPAGTPPAPPASSCWSRCGCWHANTSPEGSNARQCWVSRCWPG